LISAVSCASIVMRTQCVAVVLAALSVGVCSYDDGTQVTVAQGALRGHYFTSRKGRQFVGFQGVPYAKPPLGELRFRVSGMPKAVPTPSLASGRCCLFLALLTHSVLDSFLGCLTTHFQLCNSSEWSDDYKNWIGKGLKGTGHDLFQRGCIQIFRTGHLERELQMVQLSATRCSCIAILWVSLVSFAAMTLCVASQRVFVVVVVYFVIDSVRKVLDTPSYYPKMCL
jgi:hypothetical protein